MSNACYFIGACFSYQVQKLWKVVVGGLFNSTGSNFSGFCNESARFCAHFVLCCTFKLDLPPTFSPNFSVIHVHFKESNVPLMIQMSTCQCMG